MVTPAQDHRLDALKKAVKVGNGIPAAGVTDKHDGAQQMLVALLRLGFVPDRQLDVSQIVGNGHGFRDPVITSILHHGIGQLVKGHGFAEQSGLTVLGRGGVAGHHHGRQVITQRQVEENGRRELDQRVKVVGAVEARRRRVADQDGALAEVLCATSCVESCD